MNDCGKVGLLVREQAKMIHQEIRVVHHREFDGMETHGHP